VRPAEIQEMRREMIESYTASAGRTLIRADRLARRRGSTAVEPLDLLASLSAEPESRAAELLMEFGVERERIWAELDPGLLEMLAEFQESEFDTQEYSTEPAREALPFSPGLRLVLSEAMMHARGIDRKREVGTEHLLAGLLTTAGRPAELLEAAGLEPQSLRERLTEATLTDTSPLALADGITPLDLGEPGGGADLARILDASANRAREGLRVAEDYVRFVLDDPGLTKRFKEVRHRLAEAERGLDGHLLVGARDTREDVGTHIMTPSEQIRENPRAVLAANFKRIGEALRSLEEYTKLIDIWLAGRFEVLRYDVYTLEKLTMTAVAAHRGLGNARLMVLVGGLPTIGELTWTVGEALAGGAQVIQYREKGLPDRELLRRAREIRILTVQARVPLIMNDRVDLARLASCDGVHVGQDDLTPRDARRVMGPAALIGVSTHDRSQLEAAILAGAGYLGVGPVFPSATKEFSEPELAGLGYVRLAAETTSLPWFAIGGITEDNVDRVLEAGATRVAVSGAVLRSKSPRRAVARLKATLEGADLPDDGDDR
jgi:thiamine-phosphate pyrophosphorylase